MIRQLTAVSLIAVGALAACSDDADSEETTAPETISSEGTDGTSDTDGNTDTEGTDGAMAVDGDQATSTDGRYTFTLADGWQAYPAPLSDNVNITVLLVAGVNESEFVPNLVGTWMAASDVTPSTYEDWKASAEEVLGGEGTEITGAEPLQADGETINGIRIDRTVDGVNIIQIVYLIQSEEGNQEVAYTALPDDFDTHLPDIQSMIESISANN
ncbi:MAG: hypothetical protein QMB98_07930 [Flaviflexus sp.]|uniref:hypothetical protein n=1 Tax=Flaviflexus sp. TaxID=1969482 RepID=UPI00352D700D